MSSREYNHNELIIKCMIESDNISIKKNEVRVSNPLKDDWNENLQTLLSNIHQTFKFLSSVDKLKWSICINSHIIDKTNGIQFGYILSITPPPVIICIVKTEKCHNINVHYKEEHFNHKLYKDNKNDLNENVYQNLLNIISKQFNLYNNFELYIDQNGDNVTIHDIDDIITALHGENTIELFIKDKNIPNHIDQHNKLIDNKIINQLKNMGFNQGLIEYVMDNNPYTQNINILTNLCFKSQDFWYNNHSSHGHKKYEDDQTKANDQETETKKNNTDNDRCIGVWQYQHNGKWMDLVMTGCEIEKLDINGTHCYTSKNQKFIILKKSASTGVVMNGKTMKKWHLRRVDKSKDIVGGAKIIRNENKQIMQLNEEINRLKQELAKENQQRLEIEMKYEKLRKKVGYIVQWKWTIDGKSWNAYNAETSKIIENLAISKSFKFKYSESIITKLSIDRAINVNMTTNVKRKLKRIEIMKGMEQQKKEIIGRDKIIKRLKSEKDNFRLKAKEEEKQKLNTKMEFEQLKKNTGLKWKWLDTDNLWKPFDDEISTNIESLRIYQSYRYIHCIKWIFGNTEETIYKITKVSTNTAIQTNMTNNIQQKVKRMTVLDDKVLIIEQQEKGIVDRDKKIKKLESEKENFRLKAEEEEKQKLHTEMECEQLLKKNAGFTVSWKWMDNDKVWKPYDDKISTMIEKLKINQSYNYTYSINKQTYKITKLSKNKAIQINIETNAQRKVKRIKKICGLSNVKYPEFWNVKYISEANYAKPMLIDLPLNSTHSKELVMERFFETVNKYQYEICKIEVVQNQMLYDSYWNECDKLIKLIGESQLNEKFLFHGTKQDVMTKIQIQGFRKEFNITSRYGEGTYFARDAKYSVHYTHPNTNGIYKMFLCSVICGQMHTGNMLHKLTEWPTKNDGLIYDSLVDSMLSPSIYVIHENVRSYPMFIVHFRKK